MLSFPSILFTTKLVHFFFSFKTSSSLHVVSDLGKSFSRSRSQVGPSHYHEERSFAAEHPLEGKSVGLCCPGMCLQSCSWVNLWISWTLLHTNTPQESSFFIGCNAAVEFAQKYSLLFWCLRLFFTNSNKHELRQQDKSSNLGIDISFKSATLDLDINNCTETTWFDWHLK